MSYLNKIKYLIACICFLLTVSCSEEFLDRENRNESSSGIIFSSTDNAQLALNGLIGSLTQKTADFTVELDLGDKELGGYPSLMVLMDFMGEDIPWFNKNPIPDFNSKFIKGYTWEITNGANFGLVEYNWSYPYLIIGRANEILDNIDAVTGKQSIKNNIKGQALAVRAFMYLHLVQLFGDRYDAATNNDQLGPIIYTSSSKEPKPQSTVGQVHSLINDDLDTAISLLDGERIDKSYINKSVAQGLRARAALLQEDWDMAISMADAAISGFSLMTNNAYQSGFNDNQNQEWLWGWPREFANGNGTVNFWGFMAWNSRNPEAFVNPRRISSKLYNEVENISNTDIRLINFSKSIPDDSRFTYSDDDGNPVFFDAYNKVAYHAFKFASATWGESSGRQQGDTPAMRAAEMLLIKAEAQQRNPSISDAFAAQTLFELNSNRDTNYTLSVNAGQALLEEIWLYRRLELWGEGFRFKDLKRNNLPLDRTESNHDADIGQEMNIPSNSNRWTMKPPLAETTINPFID